jgi:dihydrofolate synthase/folylpolyglutamate synthase
MLTYEQALRVIFSRSDFERGVRPPNGERVWRREPVHEFLSAVGDPQRRYHAVHVAGTKGKGSTSAMIDAMLRAAGYCSGLYTSPHLHTFRERIRLDGESISEADLIAVVEELSRCWRRAPR